MKILQENQPYRAIDASALVPARGGLLLRVAADGNHVVRGWSETKMAGQVVIEAHIAVGTVAQMKTVDPDVAIGHHAVEDNVDVTMGVSGGQ